MRKFLNGEREFAQNQIVYFVEQDGGKLKLSFGKVDSYFGSGVFYILVYSYPQLKGENDVAFLVRFTNVDLTDTSAIKDAIFSGVLTEGVLRHFDRGEYLNMGNKVYKDDIFTGYASAQQELDKRNKNNQEKLMLINTMSEYEYTLYDMENIIKYLTKESKAKVRKLILGTDVPNIFSMEIADSKFKYKYFNKECIDLCQVEYEKTEYEKRKEIEDAFPEHYLVTVSKSYDEDRPLFVREFTNDSPDVIFEKYGKDPENILSIVNRKWSMNNGLETPVGYRDGYSADGKILITNYKFNRGTFDLRNGEIGEVNISLDRNHSVDNLGFHKFNAKNSSLSDREIEKKFHDLIMKIVGEEFGGMIYNKIISYK
ncbi:MAG: hypothetical protein RR313_09275 [Anaerovoracaceae bacterium]